MRPIYFPYTTLSAPLLGALLTCFKQLTVYQPSRNHVPEMLRNWEAGGRLHIRLPDQDPNDPLPHLLKAYSSWAEIHKGERPDFEKFRPPATPHYDSSTTSRIRSDIKNAATGLETVPSPDEKEHSLLLRARLFLTVAQEHDRLRQALREDLDRIEKMEKGLFRNLVPDRDEPFPIHSLNRSAETSDTGLPMSDVRITAWARLHLHHRKQSDPEAASMPETPDLLITSDQSALDQLLAQAGKADRVCGVSGVPFGSAADMPGNSCFDQQLHEKIMGLAAGPIGSAGLDTFFSDAGRGSGDTGRLTIYRAEGDVVTRLLEKPGNRPEPSDLNQATEPKQYTLVGSIIKNAIP